MADSAENTRAEGAGGGPGDGRPAEGARSEAQGAGTSASAAPPQGGTPAATAPSQDDSTDWKKRYDDTERWAKEKATEAKQYQEQLDAYRERFGDLPDPNAQTQAQDPWSFTNQTQQPQTMEQQIAALPPHMQGVKDALDQAVLAGDGLRYAQLCQQYGLFPAQQTQAPTPQQGLTAEQVQQIAAEMIRKSVEYGQQLDDALTGAAGSWGRDFMSGEIEHGGVKTTRERALAREMERRGTANVEATMWDIDPQGMRERIGQLAVQQFQAEQQSAAAAGQLPSMVPQPKPQEPSSALNQELKGMGIPTAPPQGKLKSILTGQTEAPVEE